MTVLGFMDGPGDALVALSQTGAGYWSDKIRKRKVFIGSGYLLARVGYAKATHGPDLILFWVMDRAGKIRAALRGAMIADIST